MIKPVERPDADVQVLHLNTVIRKDLQPSRIVGGQIIEEEVEFEG